MGMLSFCLGKLQSRASAARRKRVSNNTAGACDAARQCERPLSLAELIAASAFLDFGDMLNERWLAGRDRDDTGAGRK
jgi:hypothetical protein